MIWVIDYQMGNLASVSNMLDELGAEHRIVDHQSPTESLDTPKPDGVILPGVGSMRVAMAHMDERGLSDMVRDLAAAGVPILGICLGMQMLFDRSEEGDAAGLGLIPGEVMALEKKPGLKIPHMGWNQLADVTDPRLQNGSYMYFVHSYACVPKDASVISARSFHGQSFAAAVRRGSLTGCQFHPEKSGEAGQDFLRGWLADCLVN